MNDFQLAGVIPALVTPRDDAADDADLPRLAEVARRLLSAGVHGLFPTSSTGEANLLTRDQRRRVVETVVETVDGAVPVLAGAGAASTAESVRLARDAEAARATHIAVLPVHFVAVSPDELFGYFAAVADSVSVPTLLYNYPARTGGQNIPASVAARLAERHNVVGIKDSGGDMTNTMGYIQACPPGFAVFVGAESQVLPTLLMGGAGTICAAANVVPARIVALYDAARRNDWATARRHQEALLPLRRLFQQGTFPAPVKAAMASLGQPVGGPFLPVLPLTAKQTEEIRPVLEKISLLGDAA